MNERIASRGFLSNPEERERVGRREGGLEGDRPCTRVRACLGMCVKEGYIRQGSYAKRKTLCGKLGADAY